MRTKVAKHRKDGEWGMRIFGDLLSMPLRPTPKMVNQKKVRQRRRAAGRAK